MKFSKLDKQLLTHVIEKRVTIPILHAAYYENNRLSVTDMELEAILPCELGNKRLLLNLMPIMPDITFGEWQLKDNALISDQGFTSHNNDNEVGDIAAFPKSILEDVEGANLQSITLKAELLNHIFSLCLPCANRDTFRYYLNGIFYNGKAFAATDGHRLAQYLFDSGEEWNIIIGTKFVKAIMLLCQALPSEDIKLSTNGTKLIVDIAGYKLIGKLVDGKYPDYERVIPKANDKLFNVNSKQFWRCINALSKVIKERAERVQLNKDGDNLKIHYEPAYRGIQYTTRLAATGEFPDGYALNVAYLKAAINNVKAYEDIELSTSDNASPMILKTPSLPEFLQVVMPMRF